MDEYLYLLKPDEIKIVVPRVEEAMLRGMRKVVPDVKTGVETSIMKYWNKKAVTFDKLQYDEYGNPIIELPPFVAKIKQAAQPQKEV